MRLHLAINMFYHSPIEQGVCLLQCGVQVYRLSFMEELSEILNATAVTEHGKGPLG